jgi:hypothetical protein
MTLPDERYRALKAGKKLLEELCDPGKTPRVPSIVRDRARAALRHFPQDYEIDTMTHKCPELLDKDTPDFYYSGIKKIGEKDGKTI